MNILDIIFSAIVALLFLRGIVRGLVVEAASILGAVAGFFLARSHHARVSPLLAPFVPAPWDTLAAYLGIFLATLIATSLLAAGIRKLLTITFAAWIDSFFGGVVGLAKGLVVCLIIFVALARFTPDAAFMASSLSAPYLKRAADLILHYAPLGDVVAKQLGAQPGEQPPKPAQGQQPRPQPAEQTKPAL